MKCQFCDDTKRCHYCWGTGVMFTPASGNDDVCDYCAGTGVCVECDKEDKVLPIPAPEDGDMFSIQEFVQHCKDGVFGDYDGFGQYSTATGMSVHRIKPSDVTEGKTLKDFTHVVWFNR